METTEESGKVSFSNIIKNAKSILARDSLALKEKLGKSDGTIPRRDSSTSLSSVQTRKRKHEIEGTARPSSADCKLSKQSGGEPLSRQDSPLVLSQISVDSPCSLPLESSTNSNDDKTVDIVELSDDENTGTSSDGSEVGAEDIVFTAEETIDDEDVDTAEEDASFPFCLCLESGSHTNADSDGDTTKANRTICCAGIDSISGQNVGCKNTVSSPKAFRSSLRCPFLSLCDSHIARMTSHCCCPNCAVFCFQGKFAECRQPPRFIPHLFHLECSFTRYSETVDPISCPHCGSGGSKYIRIININLNPARTSPSKSEDHTSMVESAFGLLCRERSVTCVVPTVLRSSFPNDADIVKEAQKRTIGFVKDSLVQQESTHSFGPEKLKELEAELAKIMKTKKYKPTPNICKAVLNWSRQGRLNKLLEFLARADLVSINLNIISHEDEHQTPLLYAVSGGFYLIAYLLLLAGADINLPNKDSMTPLIISVQKGNVNLVKLLLEMGASPLYSDHKGRTALHHAVDTGRLKLVEVMLKSNIALLNKPDDEGITPFFSSCHQNNSIISLYLYNCGIDHNQRDFKNNNILHYLAECGNSNLAERVFGNLSRSHHDGGGDPNKTVKPVSAGQSNNDVPQLLNEQNASGQTPLHIAIKLKKFPIAELYVRRGADVTIHDRINEEPMDILDRYEAKEAARPQAGTSTSVRSMIALKKMIAELVAIPQPRILLSIDVAGGREKVPVPLFNNVDSEELPTNFYYTANRINTELTHPLANNIDNIDKCTCSGPSYVKNACYDNKTTCQCVRMSGGRWYSNGLLRDTYDHYSESGIFECNDACRCSMNCCNRVAQHGLKWRLAIFRTKFKGWGVKALQKIPKGAYICEYTGELLTNEDVDKRQDDSFFLELEKVENAKNAYGLVTVIDAARCGNVSRFFNHSCNANLTPVRVFWDHHDFRYPHVCFYAHREIMPHEEMTFNYGERYWGVKAKSNMYCCCDDEDCQYSAEAVNRTLVDLAHQYGIAY